MAYQVLTAEKKTLIIDTEFGLQVKVKERDKQKVAENTAYCIATLYKIKGGFVPEKVYVFEAVAATDLSKLKLAVDFFFSNLLDTELYVKEVPPDSTLFAEESIRLYGKNEEEKINGTISAVSAGRPE
jgi:hypothetical protein